MSEHEELEEGEEPAPPGVRTMSIVRWAIVGLMALAALFSVLYASGLLHASSKSESDIQYYCPMHPSVVQDHSGECPICSMTLVPRTKDSENAASQTNVPGLAIVALTPERIQLTGMKTAPVERKKLTSELRTVGYVTANEEGLAEINTRFAGWIEELFVSKTGEKVAKGQVLAKIYSPELLAAQNELLNARRWKSANDADGGASLATDARHRLELLGISDQEIRAIEESGVAVRALEIRSPAAGYVAERNVVRGAYVEPGASLFRVADLSRVWVLAEIYERDLTRVAIAQKASFQVTAFPDKSFTGAVGYIYPSIDPSTRTLRVRIVLPNRDLILRPGQYGDVTIDRGTSDALVVPADAVVDTGKNRYVFLALAGGRFEPRLVRTGERAGDDMQILEGLNEGDVVVTTANFLIDSESRLRAAISGQTSGSGSSCENDFDAAKMPDKYEQCRACEIQHRGMGTMEEDCKKAIAKPWR